MTKSGPSKLSNSWTRRSMLSGLSTSLILASIAVLPMTPKAHAAEELKIGMAHSQTGWAAAFDVAFAAGFRFAADEINASGGIDGKIPVRLVQGRDAASSSAEAVKSVEALLGQGVSVLMMSADSSGTIAAGRGAQKQGVLMFSSTGSQPAVVTQVGEGMYLSNFSDNLMGGALAIYARDELGIRDAFLLKSPDDAYTEKLPEYFAEVFQKKGGTILGESEFNFNQVDFGSVVAEIRALPKEPEAIMTAAFEPDFPALLRQLRAAGIKSRILGADAIDTPTIFALGSIADGTVVLTNRVPVDGSKYKEIEARFAQKHPEHVENAAWIVGYTAMEVIADAARRAGSIQPEALRKAIDETKDFNGPSGPITFEGRGRLPLWPVHVLEIERGKGVFKKSIVPHAEDIPTP